MSKDEAFGRWLSGRPLGAQGPDYPRDHIECVAKDAWHAAVKHTLAHVAGELEKDADKFGARGNCTTGSVARYARILAADIVRMEP